MARFLLRPCVVVLAALAVVAALACVEDTDLEIQDYAYDMSWWFAVASYPSSQEDLDELAAVEPPSSLVQAHQALYEAAARRVGAWEVVARFEKESYERFFESDALRATTGRNHSAHLRQ